MIDTNSIIKSYVEREWKEIKENANSGYSYQDMRKKISGEAMKHYWLEKVYTERIRKTQTSGLFHIHDLSDYCVYCVGWSMEDLLTMGFGGVKGKQLSKPPKHFSTALGQSINKLYTTQNDAAGAQAYSSYDTYLAPFIAYDGLDQEQVDQIVQHGIFSWMVDSRQGAQTPFTNVTLDQHALPHFDDKMVIIGGKETGDVYSDFDKEIRMFNEAWWKVKLKGDALGRPQGFPIETLNVTEDFDWDDELLFEVIAKRGLPYISNFINSDMDPRDSFSMCCRLRNDKRELRKRNGGFFGSGEKTGSIGVASLNLPLMGYLSRNEDNFFELFDNVITTAKDSLELKRREIERLMGYGFYPYSRVYLQSMYNQWGEWWRNHFSTIGLVGMNEMLLNLLGVDIVSDEGYKFANKVMDHMNNRLMDFQEETGNMYNGEATPAESTAPRLALNDLMRHPGIITAGTPEAPFYTNSTYIPTNHHLPLSGLVEHQNEFLKKYTGGSVLHVWGNEREAHWEGVSKLLRNICENSEIPYMTYTPTQSVCPVHGFFSGEYYTCPTCGSEMEVYSRITGYFAEVSRWNDGKRQEFLERPHYTV